MNSLLGPLFFPKLREQQHVTTLVSPLMIMFGWNKKCLIRFVTRSSKIQ